jgi:hypothetical protein
MWRKGVKMWHAEQALIPAFTRCCCFIFEFSTRLGRGGHSAPLAFRLAPSTKTRRTRIISALGMSKNGYFKPVRYTKVWKTLHYSSYGL